MQKFLRIFIVFGLLSSISGCAGPELCDQIGNKVIRDHCVVINHALFQNTLSAFVVSMQDEAFRNALIATIASGGTPSPQMIIAIALYSSHYLELSYQDKKLMQALKDNWLFYTRNFEALISWFTRLNIFQLVQFMSLQERIQADVIIREEINAF